MSKLTVLITSAGGAAALNCINALSSQRDFDLRIVSVDADIYSAGLYMVDNGYVVPRIQNEEYIEAILIICEIEQIEVILPTFSAELAIFARQIKRFNDIGIQILVSPLQVIEIFENKWNAFQFFQEHTLLTPKTWLIQELPTKPNFPLFLKPLIGSGSRNSYCINDEATLNFYLRGSNSDCIVQEYIQGQEITVDIIADRESSVVAAIARERIKIRNGLAVVASTIDNKMVLPYIEKIVLEAGLVGPINIQAIINNGQYFFIDINARFAAGGLPLAIAAGINIPLLTLKLALGIPVNKTDNSYQTGLTMMRYYTEVIVDQKELKSKFLVQKGE